VFRFEYSYQDYELLLQDIAKKMGATVTDNQMQFPQELGSGMYSVIKLPNGLHANIINVTLAQDWVIHRKKTTDEYYTLRFDNLTIPGSFAVTISDETVKENNTVRAFAYITSSLFDWSYYGTKGTIFQGVNIIITKEWLAKYLDIKSAEQVLSAYISLKAENINIEPMDAKYKEWIKTILETDETNPLRMAVIQNRIMLMIERFFSSLYEKMQNPSFRIPLSPDDINRVMKIEIILTEDIYQSPPSIQQLAKMVAISESKLKKDFKVMYGSPIYEYYQKVRMQAAQDKLLTGKFSVKEVAMELGYSNLSNFTIAFKKEFGILPSQLLS